MASGLEVEAKYRLDDAAAFRARVLALAGGPGEIETHEDRYFAAPDRDFARTDEACRLRVANGAAVLTYKGPKFDAATKTRREIEVPLAAGTAAAAGEFLAALGYRETLTVRKTRERWRLVRAGRPCEICLDQVAGLPPHAEIETLAAPAELDAARAALAALAAELGFAGPSERRSYLELLLGAGAR